jgi:hypothetical protein
MSSIARHHHRAERGHQREQSRDSFAIDPHESAVDALAFGAKMVGKLIESRRKARIVALELFRRPGSRGKARMNCRSIFALVALVALVSGCQQTTSIQSAWFDTDFAGPPFRKVIVVGITDNVSDARVFEDIFAGKLRAAGVDGVAGHAIISNDTRESDSLLDAAVAKSGAQGLLLVRLLSVDTRTQVTTMMVRGGMAWGVGTRSAPGQPLVPAQRIYDLATVETKLFGVQTKQLVWAATTNTFNPGSVERETPAFADLIIGQLASRGIIPSLSQPTR